MSANDLDRRLMTFFEAASAEALPEGLIDDVYEVTREMSQRRRPAARRTAALASWWANPFGIAPQLRFIAVAALLLIVLAAALVYVAGHWRRLPPPYGLAGNGLIVFDIDQQLYVAEPDGTAAPLDIGLGLSWDATFSPDGTQLAFWSQAKPMTTPVNLMVADADGSHVRSLTGDMSVVAFKLASIAWSPDGRHIAFASESPDGISALYVAAVDGSGVRAITRDDEGVSRKYPAWSPRGDLIAFQRSEAGDVELAWIAPDGTGEQALLHDPEYSEGSFVPVWSPDGTRLAYARTLDGYGRVGILDLDLREDLMVTMGVGGPAWSNDGTRLAYSADRGIALIDDLKGHGFQIPAELGGYFVSWSPDDRFLLGAGLCTNAAGPCGAAGYRIPLDDPEAAIRLSDASGDLRLFSQQRVAP